MEKLTLTTQRKKAILTNIRNQECVLFLGSGVFNQSTDSSINTFFQNLIDSEDADHTITYYKEENLLFLQDYSIVSSVAEDVRDFYTKAKSVNNLTNELLRKIAKIPFSTIITLSPSKLLHQAFYNEELGFYDDVNKISSREKVEYPHKTLIHDLLGNIDDLNSLIITHEQLYEYIKTILVNTSEKIPEKLDDILDNAKLYIFLGVDLNQWYIQMLFYGLKINRGRISRLSSSTTTKAKENTPINQSNKKAVKIGTNEGLYNEMFKIKFIVEDEKAFINDLYEYCKINGALKPSQNTSNKFIKQTFIELLKKDRTEETLNELELKIKKSLKPDVKNYEKEIIILIGRYTRLKDRILEGRISFKDEEVERNDINYKIIQILSEIEKEF